LSTREEYKNKHSPSQRPDSVKTTLVFGGGAPVELAHKAQEERNREIMRERTRERVIREGERMRE